MRNAAIEQKLKDLRQFFAGTPEAEEHIQALEDILAEMPIRDEPPGGGGPP